MSEHLKEIVSWLGIFGIPTIFAMASFCLKSVCKFAKQMKILMAAQKAQMRSQLLEQYHIHMKNGYIEDDDLDDWENQYQAYHALVGPNGVLDSKREKLYTLPDTVSGSIKTRKPKPIEEKK